MRESFSVEWATPWFLWLLLLLPFWIWLEGKRGPVSGVGYSSIALLQEVSAEVRCHYGFWLKVLRVSVLVLIIIALARPQWVKHFDEEETVGIDIVLALDFSGSMKEGVVRDGAEEISRFEAMERVTNAFLDEREGDRIGAVGFAKYPSILSPLTTDYDWIRSVFLDVQLKPMTAIGSAVVVAVDMMRSSEAPSKVVLLITDGENNTGVSPMNAARVAQKLGMRLYIVQLISAERMRHPNPANHPMGKVCSYTGGMFFQATNQESLKGVYQSINEMETGALKVKRYREASELFYWLALVALGLLALEFLLAHTRWTRLP